MRHFILYNRVTRETQRHLSIPVADWLPPPAVDCEWIEVPGQAGDYEGVENPDGTLGFKLVNPSEQ